MRHPVKTLLLSFYRQLAAAGYLVADALGAARRLTTVAGSYVPEPIRAASGPCTTASRRTTSREPDEEPSEPTIVYMGRIDPIKDLHTLIRAFAIVRAEIPSARLRIFGDTSAANSALPQQLRRPDRRAGDRRLGDAGRTDRPTGRCLPPRSDRGADQHLGGLPVHRGRGHGLRATGGVHERRRGRRGGRRRRSDGAGARPRALWRRPAYAFCATSDLRARLGTAARARVLANFTLASSLDVYRRIYTDADRVPTAGSAGALPYAARRPRSRGVGA